MEILRMAAKPPTSLRGCRRSCSPCRTTSGRSIRPSLLRPPSIPLPWMLLVLDLPSGLRRPHNPNPKGARLSARRGRVPPEVKILGHLQALLIG